MTSQSTDDHALAAIEYQNQCRAERIPLNWPIPVSQMVSFNLFPPTGSSLILKSTPSSSWTQLEMQTIEYNRIQIRAHQGVGIFVYGYSKKEGRFFVLPSVCISRNKFKIFPFHGKKTPKKHQLSY